MRWRSGSPKSIRVDNGPEFVSRALDQWAYLRQVTLDFSRPGKPTDNALVESFNRRLRDECLNTSWFLSLDDGERKIEAWRELREQLGEPGYRAFQLRWSRPAHLEMYFGLLREVALRKFGFVPREAECYGESAA